MQMGQGIRKLWAGTESQELTVFKLWPWAVTLTFKVQTSNMRVTNRLVELNISSKEYAIGQGITKLWAGQGIVSFQTFNLTSDLDL